MQPTSHDSEAAANGQQVITAVAFIHQPFDGVEKVFMAKRADTKKFLPGVYELPGGHIDYGEDPVVGLRREAQEELGIDITVGDPFFVFTYTNHIKGSHSIEVMYFARLISPLHEITLHPDDHSSSDWFAENELEKIVTANKDIDDIEFNGVRKGFAILRGEPLET